MRNCELNTSVLNGRSGGGFFRYFMAYATDGWISGKYDAVVAFACRYILILDFEGSKNSFLDFTNFSI